MISLIPSRALPGQPAKGHSGANCRDMVLSKARWEDQFNLGLERQNAHVFLMGSLHFPILLGLGKAGRSVKRPEDVRQCAAAQGIAEKEALAKGMEKKRLEFVDVEAEIYQKA